MELKFTKDFKRDRDFYSGDDKFFSQLAGKMKNLQEANLIEDVSGMIPIRGRKVHYRFKLISGKIVYRVCIKILHNKVWFTIIDTYKKRFYDRI